MKQSTTASVVLTLAVSLPLFAQQAPFDIKQDQSPAKPAPKWLKIIDQGINDPRLKGYFTPEGIKVEIVADYPTVVNPVRSGISPVMKFARPAVQLASA